MLLDIQNNKRRLIFCYLRGTHHFDLFYNIFNENKDIDFYFTSNFITADDYRKSSIYTLDNVYFIDDIKKFKFKFSLFGAFITTDAQATAPHEYSLKLINFFNKLHIPVIELQHGLFQLGLHYYDKQDKENFRDDSLPTSSFAEHILTYYPVVNNVKTTTIGYPPYNKDMLSYKGEYNLILSNMHWLTYTNEEKYNFYKTVLQFTEKNKDTLFIWKMHHGEMVNPHCQHMLNNLFTIFPDAKQNIIFYHENDILKNTNIFDLINKANIIISTVSTVLLDCERCKKETYTFSSPAVDCLTKKLKNPQCFKNYEELHKILQSKKHTFSTGLLQKFDNKKFRDCINALYKRSNLNQPQLLSRILSFE